MLRRLLGRTEPRLRLSQSLGAFTRPDRGDISPLYVFFDVANAGRERVEITRIYAARKNGGPAHDEPLGGDHALPVTLEPGGKVRFSMRAKTLAQNLKEAGHGGSHGGRPRLRLVAEDGHGNVHEKRFTFRADEYLQLKDE